MGGYPPWGVSSEGHGLDAAVLAGVQRGGDSTSWMFGVSLGLTEGCEKPGLRAGLPRRQGGEGGRGLVERVHLGTHLILTEPPLQPHLPHIVAKHRL